MKKFFKLIKCPYCNGKISYIDASFLKTKGEYSCERCNCISNVVINKTLYAIASGICIVALLIVLLYSTYGDHGSLWGIIFVLIPFIAFYAIVPFFIRLEPCKDKSAVKKIKDKSNKIMPSEAALEHAKIRNTDTSIELNVSDDFSAKFLNTKNNLESSKSVLSDEEKNNITDLSVADGFEEDIYSSANIELKTSESVPDDNEQ